MSKFGLFQFQPSEVGKMIIIFTLSKFLTDLRNLNFVYKIIGISFLITGIPALLVFKQPDLGTAILIAIGGFAVIWLAGFKLKYFLYSFFILICLTPIGISFLKSYQ